jgi:predicted permease
MALAMVLLVSSALLVQSFWKLRSVELGFNPESVLAMEMDLPETKYQTPEELGVFQRDLLAKVEALPGVESAGLVTTLPSQGHQATFYTIPEQDLPDDERRPVVGVRTASPGYFQTMGISLLQGRFLDVNDDATAPRVILINETFRSQHWSGEDPLGEYVQFQPELAEIVGVVEDVRVFGPTSEAPAMVYFSSLREPERNPSLAIRTSGDPLSLAPQVRDLVSSIDPDQPVYGVTSMETLLREATGGDTIMAKIMGALAVVAFLLALVGVYGVMAYTVSRRLQEIGIRMALGADSNSVRMLILKQGATLAAFGIGLGTLLSLGVTRGLSFFLFGVSPFHLPTFVGVAGALLSAAVVATILPARRATRIDPIDALRSE